MATEYPTLSNPPITEALIDIQVRFKDQPQYQVLRDLAEELSEELPLTEDRNVSTFSFAMQKGGPKSTIDHEQDGVIARSENKDYALQLLKDRLAFSRLAPYKDWEDLRKQTEKYWALYRDAAKPERISRLAVRYINKLLFPVPIDDFGEYFVKPIEIPDKLPQGLGGFSTRLVIPHPELNAVAIINQMLEGESSEGMVSIIFDVDVYKNVDFDATDDDSVWNELEQLRGYKNDIFFSYLKDDVIEGYK